MTGYTVHTGSNDNFREGWDNVFGDKKKSVKKSVVPKTAKAPAAKSTKKKTPKKK